MVKIEEVDIQFTTELSLQEYSEIENRWDGFNPTGKFYWWYRITSFGLFVLEHLTIDEENHKKFIQILGYIRWDNWWMFIPVLKNFFITFKEYHRVIRNMNYVRKGLYEPEEDIIFNTYLVHKYNGGSTSYKELMDMNLKSFIKIYYYGMADIIIDQQRFNKAPPPEGIL